MKLSKNKLPDLIVKLLADVELVDDDSGDSIDNAYDSIVNNTRSEYKPVIEQELTPAIKQRVAGEMGDMQRKTVAKIFGITDKKTLEGKNLDEILALGKEHLTNTLKLDVNESNSRIQELSDQLASMADTHQQEIGKINSEWQTKYDMRDVNEHLLTLVNGLPRKGGDLATQAQMLMSAISAKGYQPKYDADKKKLNFYKDNQLVIEDGKTIDDVKFAKEWADKAGILATDTRHINAADVHTGKLPAGGAKPNPNDPYAAVKAWAGAEA